MGPGGNIFETEIYYNYFRVNFLVELDRLGTFQDFELDKGSKGKIQPLSIDKKRERLSYLLQALTHIWGGGKQSRLLTDMSPKFLAITFQNSKAPIFLETLTVKENEELHIEAIQEVLSSNKSSIRHQILGLQSGIFKNADFEGLGDVMPIQKAFEAAGQYIQTLDF